MTSTAPLEVDGARLDYHLARPPGSAARGARAGLVIAHGMPTGDDAAAHASVMFPELADRVARDTGGLALSFSFRGAGRSPGSFSPAGWLRDLTAAVELLRAEAPEAPAVFIAGFGLGGALALRAAANDPGVAGVAALAAPADPVPGVAELAACATASGYCTEPTPADVERWATELQAIDPVGAVAAIPPRPLLLVHGSVDALVPIADARVLSDAAAGAAELRIVAVAAHRLRHEPRAIALLLGWLQRHG